MFTSKGFVVDSIASGGLIRPRYLYILDDNNEMKFTLEISECSQFASAQIDGLLIFKITSACKIVKVNGVLCRKTLDKELKLYNLRGIWILDSDELED